MSNGDDDGSMNDKDVIGKDAETADERRDALCQCLDGVWINEDIARLERRDQDDWHGWLMWRL